MSLPHNPGRSVVPEGHYAAVLIRLRQSYILVN
jgi:hypothetical protein